MALGKPIASTAHSEVYVSDKQQVLKLVVHGTPADQVAEEARITAAAHAAGLTTPAVGEYGIEDVEGLIDLSRANCERRCNSQYGSHARKLDDIEIKPRFKAHLCDHTAKGDSRVQSIGTLFHHRNDDAFTQGNGI